VVSAHQDGGEPLRPMPPEITRCLRVPGAELAPPPPPVRRGPGRVVVVDTPWPNGQACHSCSRHCLVLAAPPWAPPRALPSLRPRALAWAPPRALHDLYFSGMHRKSFSTVLSSP
jgi:hypothetical protein